MVAKNSLFATPPYAVAQALMKVGTNLRLARLRRKQTIEEVAQKIGTGVRAVRDAENGKPSTAVAVYAALLWAFDLLPPLEELAHPLKDQQGLAFASAKEGRRAHKRAGLDNDF